MCFLIPSVFISSHLVSFLSFLTFLFHNCFLVFTSLVSFNLFCLIFMIRLLFSYLVAFLTCFVTALLFALFWCFTSIFFNVSFHFLISSRLFVLPRLSSFSVSHHFVVFWPRDFSHLISLFSYVVFLFLSLFSSLLLFLFSHLIPLYFYYILNVFFLF